MSYKLDTICVCSPEAGEDRHPFGALTVPIFQTATFTHPGIGETNGYDYTRESNPTRAELEHILSNLEGAADTVATNCGMSAVALVFDLLPAGSHVICSEDLYGGSVRLFNSIGKQHGLEFSFVDTSDEQLVEAALRPQTRMLYIETPSNPTMSITDLKRMREIADEQGALLVVDNTFLSPYFQNPIAFGADLVVHSGTKYLSGHNDTIAGFVCSGTPELAEKVRYIFKTVGYGLSPFDSFLLTRGIKTLAVRMDRQQSSAMKIAKWLKGQPKITRVCYPGLPEHPGYEVNLRQSRGFGGMISFWTDTEETARHILENIKLISYAESLGGVDTLITYPMLQTHGDVPVRQREKLGITENFLRLSVGIENAEDLICDLSAAMS